MNVRMPGADLILDNGDLAAAAGDSCNHLTALFGDLVERPPVTIENGLLTGIRLPAPYDHVHVLRVEFEALTSAPRLLGSDQRCPAAEEWVVATLAGQRVVWYRSAHHLHRLLRWMIELLFIRADLAQKRVKEEADLTAVYSRFSGRNPLEAGRQEELLRDARQ